MWCCVPVIVQVPLHHHHQSRCLSIHNKSLVFCHQSHVFPQIHKPSTNNAFSVVFPFNTSPTSLAHLLPISFPVCFVHNHHMTCQSLKQAHTATMAPHHQCPALSVLCLWPMHHTTLSHHLPQSRFLFPHPCTSQTMALAKHIHKRVL